MFKQLFFEKEISFENFFNAFLYYLREIPFFEDKISPEIFKRNKFKTVINIIITIFGILGRFAGKLIYSFVFLMIPYIILKQFVVGNTFEYEETVINVFFMLNCVCSSIINSVILENSDEDFFFLNIMRLDSKKHYLGQLVFKLIMDFIMYFIILIILDIGIVNSFVLVILMTSFRAIGEVLSLLIYEKLPYLYKRMEAIEVLVVLICVYFAYVNPFIRGTMVSVDAFAFNPNLLALIVTFGVISLIILICYKKYPELARKHVKRVDMAYAEAINNRSRIKEVEGKYNVTGTEALLTNRHTNKKEYSFLNHIFYDRNKKIMVGSVHIKAAWLFILFTVFGIIAYSGGSERQDLFWNFAISLTSKWLLIIWFFVSAKKMCKTIFYNCDKILKKYHFYKKNKAICSSYLVRVKLFVLSDFTLMIGVILGYSMLAALTEHISDFSMIIGPSLCALVSIGFIDITDISLYHMIQPYDENVNVSKKIFSLINVVFFIVYVIFAQLPFNWIFTVAFLLLAQIVIFVLSYVGIREMKTKS